MQTSSKQPTRKLNQGQLDILEYLYKFRFGTATLLAHSLHLKDRSFVHRRLAVLCRDKYIGKRYDSSYRIERQPAIYYLLPKGINALKSLDYINATVLKNIYKDETASQQFIHHSLLVFKLYCELKVVYGDTTEFFTKSDLYGLEHYPTGLPDALLTYKDASNPRARTKRFFINICIESKPFFTYARKLHNYIEYADAGGWDETGYKLPKVLFICERPVLEKRLQKQIARLEAQTPPNLKFCTTATTKLISLSIL